MTGIRHALDELIDPFWLSTTTCGESVVFAGSVDSSTAATLLFRPDEILSVSSATGDISYSEGDDYRIDWQTGQIVRPPGSRMPCVTHETTTAADGELTHARTIAVTYRHYSDLWQGFVPADGSSRLPRVTGRLRQREALTFCLTGDSISEGYDASGFHHLPPHQPPFGALVAHGLQRHSGSSVHFHNFGTGGWTTADALADVERITAATPDFVVIAYGMNDASYADAGEYGANVSTILSRVRADLPDAEFLLVSPMLPTPECDWLVHSRFAEYRDALANLTGEGVVLADLTAMWSALLARKNPRDLSGNGWNHPNDFGHRVYAQTILSTMGSTAGGSLQS